MTTPKTVALTFGGRVALPNMSPVLADPIILSGLVPMEILQVPVASNTSYRVQFMGLCKNLANSGTFAVGIECDNVSDMYLQAAYHDYNGIANRGILLQPGMENASHFSGGGWVGANNVLIIDGFLLTGNAPANFVLKLANTVSPDFQCHLLQGAALKLEPFGPVTPS